MSILEALGKIARYQANSAAQRGDAAGREWLELARECDLELEAGRATAARTVDREERAAAADREEHAAAVSREAIASRQAAAQREERAASATSPTVDPPARPTTTTTNTKK